MFNVQTPQGIFRRYIFWLRYDGSRFPEMATNVRGCGVVDTMQKCIAYIAGDAGNLTRVSPSSRTDSGVHAIKTPIIAHVPIIDGIGLDDTIEIKERNIKKANAILDKIDPGAANLWNFQSVHPGFCSRRHVEYRRYVYRLVVPRSMETYLEKPSLPLISEMKYSWILPPTFSVERADAACKKLQGVHNMASFFKHRSRDRHLDAFENTTKWLRHVGITRGEGYNMHSTDCDYYNVTVVSRSFVREQIRRMVAVIASHAIGRLPLRDIDWLLRTPHPANFFAIAGMKAAPPNGLFLADVSYDPASFVDPLPRYVHPWDVSDAKRVQFPPLDD
uniref:tRNA pseudouridine synthase n=1 Tax=Panagrellus redivivus TaxID=6233 RepID=A0A7E4W5L6_PANRE